MIFKCFVYTSDLTDLSTFIKKTVFSEILRKTGGMVSGSYRRLIVTIASKGERADFCFSEVQKYREVQRSTRKYQEVSRSTEKYTAEVPQNLMKYIKVHQCS
jgi:hypothetical protein